MKKRKVIEIIVEDRWNRGVTHVLPLERAGGLAAMHVANAVDGHRFIKLFLSWIMEE